MLMMTTMSRPVLLVLILLMVHLSLSHCLSLGHLEQPEEDAMAERVGQGAKRDGRRITRGRYRMGYMFGKRSDMEENPASVLVKKLMGKAMSVDDLRTALQSDPAFADRVARHLDKNGDGFVAVSELL